MYQKNPAEMSISAVQVSSQSLLNAEAPLLTLQILSLLRKSMHNAADPINATFATDAYSGFQTASSELKGSRPLDDTLPLIDVAILAAFARERPLDRLGRVLSIFTKELTSKRTMLESMIADHDVAAVGMLTHAAAGSASMVGCARLAAICHSIETQCRRRKALDWSDVDALREILGETIAAFEPLLAPAALEAKLSAYGWHPGERSST